MNEIYKRQVALLIRIMPLVYQIKDFAVHGGTAINLFHKNMPRYSVDIDLTYEDYEKTRKKLINQVNTSLTETDKAFILSFEEGNPDWSKCSAGDLSNYPSIKWKLQNIINLKETNPLKHKQGIEKLKQYFKE